jgi:hypothetical protein
MIQVTGRTIMATGRIGGSTGFSPATGGTGFPTALLVGPVEQRGFALLTPVSMALAMALLISADLPILAGSATGNHPTC